MLYSVIIYGRSCIIVDPFGINSTFSGELFKFLLDTQLTQGTRSVGIKIAELQSTCSLVSSVGRASDF